MIICDSVPLGGEHDFNGKGFAIFAGLIDLRKGAFTDEVLDFVIENCVGGHWGYY